MITALGSFLEARRRGGEWLLRIEDVDLPRTRPGAADAILRTLERYQLFWDGPVLYQSQRTAIYEAVLADLTEQGLTYPCTCSRRKLANGPRSSDGSPIYPGHCRTSPRSNSRPSAIRLQVPDTVFACQDAIQGEHQQRLARAIGDFVIRRADGCFSYQLAVVVDDAAQNITHIVRGSDLLDSTPRQIYLQHQLNLPTPEYAHLPVVIDWQGYKLSKQTGAMPLDPDHPTPTLWAALAFLGQDPPTDLQREPPAMILAWASAHWRLAHVPPRLSCPCPGGLLPDNILSKGAE